MRSLVGPPHLLRDNHLGIGLVDDDRTGVQRGVRCPDRVNLVDRYDYPIESGTLEGLKWLGLLLMTVDHVNKYLLHDAIPALFAAGRLAVPLFSFVLAYKGCI